MAHRGYDAREIKETLALLQAGLPEVSAAWLNEIAQAFRQPATADIDANDLVDLFQAHMEFRFAKVAIAHWGQLPKEIGILSKSPSLPPGPLSVMIQIMAGRSAPLNLIMDCRNALPASHGEGLRCVVGFYLDDSLQDSVRAHLLIGCRPHR